MQEGLFPSESFSDHKKDITAYKVLARKYRPIKLSDMIGQDVLVRILSNAIKENKVPHAIILTGIRGVGKTTTARILARSLNCIGKDGNGGPTDDPCGVCHNCIAITDSRHQDIIEMDAASNTGINDIRVIIDNAIYKPITSRYKIYIIDEAHMLSNSALNALLKTLEEPPPYLKFILATTEIKKIPLTILSRCQKFDLKRISVEQLSEHYINIALKEKVELEQEAARIIAMAADGSVRDGLSILDQAMTMSSGQITKKTVQTMLGLCDKNKVIHIFDSLVHGDIKGALNSAQEAYKDGNEPLIVLQDILKIIHAVIKIKICNEEENLEISHEQIKKFDSLSIPFLSRAWQITLKGIEELKISEQPFSCLEMILVRLGYFSLMPTPEEIIRKLENQDDVKSTDVTVVGNKKSSLSSIQELLDMLFHHNELDLYHILYNELAIIEFRNNYLKINPLNTNPSKLLILQKKLSELTHQKWEIETTDMSGQSLAQKNTSELRNKHDNASKHEISQEILRTFTGSKIVDIKIS